MVAEAQTSRLATLLEIVAVALLGLAGVTTAWASYQASLWDGEQAVEFTRGTALMTEATRLDLAATQRRNSDAFFFLTWLKAAVDGDAEGMRFYEEHLRPDQKALFDRWRSNLPKEMKGYRRPPGTPPLALPLVRPAEERQAVRTREKAAQAFAAGQRADANGDRFVAATVLFAIVLFLAGISQILRSRWTPFVVLLFSAFLWSAATIYMARLPHIWE